MKSSSSFALTLWNERDPILKERLFGLTNSEGNHGEDVKEYYFYIDSTPVLVHEIRVPQQEYPYGDLLETNRRRCGKNSVRADRYRRIRRRPVF
jgi:hypothetical protein